MVEFLMVFNLYILIISNLLVSRTPLITVLSTEGLSWVTFPFIIIIIIILFLGIKSVYNDYKQQK